MDCNCPFVCVSQHPLTQQGFDPMVKARKFSPTLDYITFFRDEYLTHQDLISFASTLKLCQTEVGMSTCWCLKKMDHPGLEHFTVSHPSRPLFKGRDARPLALALVDQFNSRKKPVIVRRHTCKSPHCINPAHYFYGTAQDVKIQSAKRKGININKKVVDEIRSKRESNKSEWTYQKLGNHYKLPYHVVRRICLEGAYSSEES